MRTNSRNYPVLPVEVIECAVVGETDAVQAVLRHYDKYIRWASKSDDRINDEAVDRIRAKLMSAVLKFRTDR